MSEGIICLKCRLYIEADETWRCKCQTPLRSQDGKTPYGKTCTCDNCLGSSRPCSIDAGERLGELWYCRKLADSVTGSRT